MTAEIAAQWIEEVAAGDRVPFALMCFTTNDRLTYQAWVDDLQRYIAQQNVHRDHYEDGIRAAQAAVLNQRE